MVLLICQSIAGTGEPKAFSNSFFRMNGVPDQDLGLSKPPRAASVIIMKLSEIFSICTGQTCITFVITIMIYLVSTDISADPSPA